MTRKDFQILIFDILSKQEEINHILNSETSLLINCIDKSAFYINILESKHTFLHLDKEDQLAKKYLVTHTKEEFAKDLLGMSINHPGFFLYFMIFLKLEEMQIIDSGLFYHIIDSILYYEREIDSFVAGVLSHYNTN